jgi:hypothetical protein
VQTEHRTRQPARRRRLPWLIKTGSIASDVYLDPEAGLATKVYRPRWFVRALYWISFQAPFPYLSNEHAFDAARQRRVIAGLLTRAEFGRDVVAQVVDIRRAGQRVEFVTELVRGSEPTEDETARAFLQDVSDLFARAGLDTWQVWPRNPRSVGNLIQTPSGELMIIDLESSLVFIPLPLSQWWDRFRVARFPSFDDISFPMLRRYLADHEAHLRQALGVDDYALLLEALERCHDAMHEWKDNEPRIWGRLCQLITRPFN